MKNLKEAIEKAKKNEAILNPELVGKVEKLLTEHELFEVVRTLQQVVDLGLEIGDMSPEDMKYAKYLDKLLSDAAETAQKIRTVFH